MEKVNDDKKPEGNQSIHQGHRERLKKRFRQQGIASFDIHNVLELLLFYAIPIKDTNEEAHLLLETFGSFVNVFDAPYEDLVKVRGISENSATLIKLIPQLCQMYYELKVEDAPPDSDNIAEYLGKRLVGKYIGEVNEVAYLICLDNRLRILFFGKLGEGTNDSVSILTRKIVEISIRCNASSVILAHNHPSGLAMPSRRDRETTKQLYYALAGVSIKLLDHIIVARGEYSSMAAGGMLSPSMMDAMRSGSSLGDEHPFTSAEKNDDWQEEEFWEQFTEIV
ncbi:MAG: JAB domain-containing protein [Angelakisella sp.]